MAPFPYLHGFIVVSKIVVDSLDASVVNGDAAGRTVERPTERLTDVRKLSETRAQNDSIIQLQTQHVHTNKSVW